MNLLSKGAINALEYAALAVRCVVISPVVVICAPLLCAIDVQHYWAHKKRTDAYWENDDVYVDYCDVPAGLGPTSEEYNSYKDRIMIEHDNEIVFLSKKIKKHMDGGGVVYVGYTKDRAEVVRDTDLEKYKYISHQKT